MTFITFLTWAYSCVGLISLTAYFPQIMSLIKNPDSARGTALSSWVIWTFTSGISFFYASFVAHDIYMIWVSGVSFSGTVAVTALTLYARHKEKLPTLGGEFQTYP